MLFCCDIYRCIQNIYSIFSLTISGWIGNFYVIFRCYIFHYSDGSKILCSSSENEAAIIAKSSIIIAHVLTILRPLSIIQLIMFPLYLRCQLSIDFKILYVKNVCLSSNNNIFWKPVLCGWLSCGLVQSHYIKSNFVFLELWFAE